MPKKCQLHRRSAETLGSFPGCDLSGCCPVFNLSALASDFQISAAGNHVELTNN